MRSARLHQLVDRRRGAPRRRSGQAGPQAPPPPTGEIPPGYDFAARRVREAGGPSDIACYSCPCGYVFSAAVSTSVCCPHCGCEQSW